MEAHLPAAVVKVLDQCLEFIYGFGPVFAPTVVLGTFVDDR